MRDTWAADQVDLSDGHIVWTLGGKHSSFRFGPNADFQWQHDVTLGSSGEVALFDDHCCEVTGAGTYLSPAGPSGGLVLRLDRPKKTATLVREYRHDGDLHAAYMGSFQRLGNSNVLVGWGAAPHISEYLEDGRVVLDGAAVARPHLPVVDRGSGVPHERPVAAARRQGGRETVYASWNGSTQVASACARRLERRAAARRRAARALGFRDVDRRSRQPSHRRGAGVRPSRAATRNLASGAPDRGRPVDGAVRGSHDRGPWSRRSLRAWARPSWRW